ncbi:hypothetical protein QN386_01980 [Pseudomonas sp. CCI3.2]|uniref:hypothetical protein n=1 Tax=unclassified Pseudomonas TaxID=196821 RepID=UPI002AC9172C|nr:MULTISPECIES: hypothetical protein [unclassified Pseudomonas]MEB0076101.1 hypothetical protein [Pseudomonas sp. MH10out]MEB0090793.1 hypothetical protein [Pseudomonas sp. CCI4.2]MEB0100099.1 hypothetical protein [Pseudomonas sp. CCI3.2]MEB0132056.1 hypothetical protein [Pseudomonas sp. CCI2.4]MEB0156146.1 hypothetical protein [Pseudomonas sp. AH2 (2023)]
MDRVVFAGCLLLIVFGILLGVGMGSAEITANQVRGVFELLSFAGSAVTAVVAVFALTSWQAQFRHAERFKSVKTLLEASNDIHKMRCYLFKLQEKFLWLLENDRKQNDLIDAEEASKKEEWFAIQDRYTKAWSAAEIFLSERERSNVPLTGKKLRAISFDLPMQLTILYANSQVLVDRNSFAWAAREIADNYGGQASATVAAIERIFSATK